MTTPTPYQSTVATASDGFRQALRAEWTKFRSVRGTVRALIAAIGLTVLLSMVGATASRTDANEGPHYVDQFHFVHRPLTGDGSVVARVATQADSHEWAKAGIVIKQSATGGAPYAALMVTPRHGVRMQGNFDTELTGGSGTAPYWLKLTRTGTAVTGYESADGARWTRVGMVDLGAIPQSVEAGLFVTSPANERLIEEPTRTYAEFTPTVGRATFDNVSVGQAGAGEPVRWSNQDVIPPPPPGAAPGEEPGAGPADRPDDGSSAPPPGSMTQAGTTFTVTGSGDVGGWSVGGIARPGDDDVVMNGLSGVQIGLMAVIALGVLFVTAEYKTATIRTTFAASPRRGRVLAAKAVVVGLSVFLLGLVASLAAFFFSLPIQRARGYEPPAYPVPSLADGPVFRAVVGTALFLAVLALFSLGVGAILRRTAGAITFVIGLVVVPQVVASVLSVEATTWVQRITPIAGLAIQQTRERHDTAIGPWAGFGVLCAYAVVALGVAFWLLRRRDA